MNSRILNVHQHQWSQANTYTLVEIFLITQKNIGGYVVGLHQYLTLTHPNIQFGVNKLSQFMSSSTQAHWTVTKKLLRYISGTQKFGIMLRKVEF